MKKLEILHLYQVQEAREYYLSYNQKLYYVSITSIDNSSSVTESQSQTQTTTIFESATSAESPSTTEYTSETTDKDSSKVPGEGDQPEEEPIKEEEAVPVEIPKAESPASPAISHLSVAGFFQNRDEIMKRWSDDTIFMGKVGTQRTFEEKIELMKKVWEVYTFMKQEGLSFEVAKMYLGNSELDIINEADLLTKGQLLRFLTVLLPDEKKYPFERPVKTKPPVYLGLPNALAIKLFNMEKKFSLRTLDMFRAIFKCFPNREYLIVTLSQGSKEPPWLDHFVVSSMIYDKNSNFNIDQ